jgi:hypothetical protein
MSPIKSVRFDSVLDVSDQVELREGEAATERGDKVVLGAYELSVPLQVLGLKPARGQTLRGDVGVVRGAATASRRSSGPIGATRPAASYRICPARPN